MSFQAGDTFLFPVDQDARQPHLWIVATNPNQDGQVAIVSLTTLKGAKDQTVTLRKGEHPFLRWDTCVAYALAEITSVDELRKRVNSNSARMHQPTTDGLLNLVLDGFLASEFTKNRVRDFVLTYKKTKTTPGSH